MILVVLGIKLILRDYIHVPPLYFLIFLVVTIATSILASMVKADEMEMRVKSAETIVWKSRDAIFPLPSRVKEWLSRATFQHDKAREFHEAQPAFSHLLRRRVYRCCSPV